MHFWIDKRSPQCGFGRSRVAASLHTGGSGLSFGHPPRRSGGHKSSSSSSSVSNAGIQVHRQHQQAATPHYHSHAATTSNSGQYRATNYAGGSGGSNTTYTTSNNNNNGSNTVANRNLNRSNVVSGHQYYNNNRQQSSGSQQHHQSQSTSCSLPISSNNNLTSPTGKNLNSSLINVTTATTFTTGTQHYHHQQPQHHAQRYRHPQFGNMSVRTYQPTVQQQQQSTPPNTTTTNLAQSSTNSTSTTTSTTATNSMETTAAAAATNQLQQSLDASLNILNEHEIHQSAIQSVNLSAELNNQTLSPRINGPFNRPLTSNTMPTGTCDYGSASSNPRITYTSSTLTSTTANANQLYHHQQQHSRQRRTTRSMESTDLQFLPLHLKCGIFASLVLAIAFIVGIKVYFDNHGTKFEVGLFWLLTATFVFAFCFVSICKVPKVLFASTTSSRSNSRDQTRDRCSMDDAMARGSMVNSIDDVVVTGLHELHQEQIQSININAQAGPPPYHIAILLPEAKAKEDISIVEESPPPSYDKILI